MLVYTCWAFVLFIVYVLTCRKIVIILLGLLFVYFTVFEKILFGDLGQDGKQIYHLFAVPLRFDILVDPILSCFGILQFPKLCF